MNILDALVQSKLCNSKGEAKRLIAQGAVRAIVPFNIGGWSSEITHTIESPSKEVEKGEIILVGCNKRFVVT